MRKFYLSFLMLVLCMASAVANPVTQNQALLKAKAFRQTRGLPANAAMELAYQGRQASHQHGAPAKDAYYYVFNNGGNTGFVIVAGDDSAESILGYADSGSFDAVNIPENMQAFLQGYAEEIAMARTQGLNSTGSEENVEVARQVIAPLVTAHWNQYEPYNQKCPLYGAGGNSGERCITGCVATALSQVMFYHKYPVNKTTSIPGYASNEVIGELAALPEITFDWDNMCDNYSPNNLESNVKKTAVATLHRYTGQAVKMNYSPNGSGGYHTMIPNALKEYFGYQNQASYVLRDDYTTDQWNNLIYNELRHARPVIYAADTSGGSGHAFVCDGYDGHEMFHINWGWGGLADGYFRLQALNPSSQGAGGSNGYGGYSLNQGAVIGISPTVVTDEVESNVANPGIETVKFVFADPSSDWAELQDQKVSFAYNPNSGLGSAYVWYWYRRVDTNQGYDVGLGLFDGDEMIDMMSGIRTNYTGSSMQSSGGGTGLYFGKNLSDGTYYVKGIDSPTGKNEWKPSVSSDLRYLEVVIANGQCTVSIVKKKASVELEVKKVEQIVKQSGNPRTLRVYLHNNGSKEFKDNLYLLLGDDLVAYECAFIPANGDGFVDFVFSASKGSYNIIVSTDSEGSDPIYSDYFDITEVNTSPELELVKAEFKNVVGDNQYGRVMELFVTLRNNSENDYNNQFTKQMKVKNDQGSFDVYNQTFDVSISAGKEVTIPLTHDLALGDLYWIIISDGRKQYFERYGITVCRAFVSWNADGTRTAVAPTTSIIVPNDALAASFEDIENFTGVTITPNSNNNTIYYFAHNATVPSSLNGKNVVKGYESSTITLTEASGFYIPQSFTASEISYSYVPTLGADGKNGWQTIMLPFAVKSVTSDGNPVDWYHGNETEDNKDFWVREFTQVSNNVVKFADLAAWMPNTPYIIAVPGKHWGEEYNMTGKTLKFSATNVKVIQTPECKLTSDAYDFIGSTCERTVSNVYVLNEKGNTFKLQESATIKPTGAYFMCNENQELAPANLYIAFDDLTGICMPRVTADDGQMVDVYAIDGVKVATVRVNGGKVDLSRLPKGIYIVEGKKIVR